MSESAVAFLDLPVHNTMSQEYPLRTVSPNVSFQTDLDLNKPLPELPSLLRLANSRFLMNKVDTNKIPDWDTLKNVTFDHDIYTAIQMISFDTLTGFDIGGKDIDKVLIDEMDDDLGIRLTPELIAQLFQVLPEFIGVLDDSVVSQGDVTIGAEMGVGVRLGRRSVGGPPGVADPTASPGRAAIQRLLQD